MRVAAFQAPLVAGGSIEAAVVLIRQQVDWCESERVDILCCPEAILGGLADYVPRPEEIAIDVESGQLESVLAPLAGDRVTTIVGFTEVDRGRLYNSAAVVHKGAILGVYRKRHPAIRRSVYDAGDTTPVFAIDDFRFGIMICNDSNYPDLARTMASRGATALFVPTNNGLPPGRAGEEIVAEARDIDIVRAVNNGVSIIRADVVGQAGELMSYGSSGIVDRTGTVLTTARILDTGLIVADV